jgi:hypothetical protein
MSCRQAPRSNGRSKLFSNQAVILTILRNPGHTEECVRAAAEGKIITNIKRRNAKRELVSWSEKLGDCQMRKLWSAASRGDIKLEEFDQWILFENQYPNTNDTKYHVITTGIKVSSCFIQ